MEIIHPGYIDTALPIDERERIKAARQFESYIPFINLSGIDPDIARKFVLSLQILFKYSPEIWHPAMCYYVPEYAAVMKVIVKKKFGTNLEVVGTEYVFNRSEEEFDSHCWLSILRDSPLIVDPTGLPTNRRMDPKHYRPYFGLQKNAPDDIYRRGNVKN